MVDTDRRRMVLCDHRDMMLKVHILEVYLAGFLGFFLFLFTLDAEKSCPNTNSVTMTAFEYTADDK